MAVPAGSKATMSLAQRFTSFINSPTGPKTTHFWGPLANWGFVIAVRVIAAAAAAGVYEVDALFQSINRHTDALA